MGAARSLRRLLVPLSWGYGAVVTVRNIFYDSGVFRIRKIDTPVISVGNITTGGTGKTPLVEHLGARLITMGLTPAFLSRGYGRSTRGTLVVSDGASLVSAPSQAGDEPVQVARKFPGCAVVVDERRVRGALFIESRFHPDVILLDDGFQHRALHRDLDIVILDEEPDASSMHLLPAGNRREPLSSIGRAGVIIVHRRSIARRTAPVHSFHGGPGRAVMSHRLKRLTDQATGREIPLDVLRKAGCVAFCGIGNPAAFQRTLRDNGITPARFVAFPDHHRFTDADLGRIAESGGMNGAGYVVTTEKDAVRLGAGFRFQVRIPPRLVVAEIEAVIEEGDEVITSALAFVGRKAA